MLKYILITKIIFLIVVNPTNQLDDFKDNEKDTEEIDYPKKKNKEEISFRKSSDISHIESDFTENYYKEIQENFGITQKVDEKSLNNPNFILKLFKLSDIKTFKKAKRETANKIINHYIYRNLNNFTNFKKLIYQSHCESKNYDDLKSSTNDNKPKTKKILSPFDYAYFEKGKKLVQKWHEFYQQFYELALSYEVKEVASDNKEIFEIIKKNLRDFPKNEYLEFFEEFKIYKKDLVVEINGMNCGVINMLNFYDLLPRFYFVFRETKTTLSISQRHRDIFFEKNEFFREFADKFFHRIYFCHFWGILLEELLFLIDNSDNSYFILMNVYSLKYFVEAATYSVTKFDDFELTIEKKYKNIINLLERIEDNVLLDEAKDLKLKKRPFKPLNELLEMQQNLHVVYGVFSEKIGIFGFFYAWFVFLWI